MAWLACPHRFVSTLTPSPDEKISCSPPTPITPSSSAARTPSTSSPVRYLLSDMTLNGGNTSLYRKYAAEERDPDSREAIRLWEAGARVINTNDFERRWVTNRFGKNGRVMRIVLRGTTRTITGDEVLLTSDFDFQQAPMRLVLAELSLGRLPSFCAFSP